MATAALRGAGDERLGEWRERGQNGVVHLRRRLTDLERALAGGLAVRDIRDSEEEIERLATLLSEAPQLLPYVQAMNS
jgi:hypothetical protein